MRRVILESPYAGDVARNKLYLQHCIRDCLARGDSPYASHQLLTEALADSDPKQRELGFKAAEVWYETVEAVVVYRDFGLTGGMILGVQLAHRLQKLVEPRYLEGVWAQWAHLLGDR